MIPNEVTESLSIQLGKRKLIKANLQVFEFIDNGFIVIYNPSLELSAYGKNSEDALHMFKEVVFKDFCENLTSLPEGKVYEELKRLGWNRNVIFQKKLSRTTRVDREAVSKEFNLTEKSEIKELLLTV